MREFLFNPGGNYAAATYFGVIPLILFLLALWQGAAPELTQSGQAGRRRTSLVLLVLLLILYGSIYWWLFYDQFYRLEIRPDGLWQLEYRLPTRSILLAATTISALDLESGGLRTYRMTRLVIVTADGERYPSAQISERQAKEYRAILAQFRQEQRERQ